MWTINSMEKSLMLGKIKGRRRRVCQRMRWMDGWHHRCNGHRIGPTSGDSDGQGGLVCYSPWSHKELDPTGQLNSDNNPMRSFYLLYHVKPALTRSSLNECMRVCVRKSLSHVQLFACQAPQSMGFSRQDYWSGLPFTSPRDLPDPGIEPRSPALQADSTIWATREAH